MTHENDYEIEGIQIEELQILVNTLGERLKISYPPLHLTLMRIEPGENFYSVNIQSSREDFGKSGEHNASRAEMPTYDDVSDCLLNSGVIKYCNLNEFEKKLKTYRSLNRAVCLSPDTNILYHGFFSNSNLVKTDEILLINTVRDEIESSLNYRYDNYQINELKKATSFQTKLFDELRNKRTKKSRRAAYLAMHDFRLIRDKAKTLKPVRESKPDSRENDITIIKTLGKHGKESSSLPVLITADTLITDVCETEGVEYFRFTVPHQIESSDCNPKQLRKLVYNLAVLFGFIKLNNIILFGEYKGKTNPGDLKARFLNTEMFQEFKKELKICRELVKLGISK